MSLSMKLRLTSAWHSLHPHARAVDPLIEISWNKSRPNEVTENGVLSWWSGEAGTWIGDGVVWILDGDAWRFGVGNSCWRAVQSYVSEG